MSIEKSYSSSPFDDPERMGGTAKDVPKEKKKNKLDSAAAVNLFNQLMDWFTQENERQAHNRYQMALDEDYYDSMQWTEEDAQVLMDRGQAPLVFNEIKPTVDWIIGTERRTRIDYRVQPRKKEGIKDAENKTQLLKYLSDVNKTPFSRSYAFEQAVKAGMGILETGLRGDPTEELLFTRAENWRNCLYDSNSTERDYSDARYFFRWKHVDEDIANAHFPDRLNVIRPAVIEGMNMHGSEDEDEIWYMGARVTQSGEDYAPVGKYRPYHGSAFTYSTRRRVKLIECWYTKPVRVKKFSYGPATGEVFDPQNPEHEMWARQGFSLYDNVQMQVWCAIFTKKGLLFNGQSPYDHNRIPFVPVWCYRRARDNAPYGVIRPLRDPQDDLNKRASKALHILSSKQVVMDENAVDDIEQTREEVARPDGMIVKKAGKMFEFRTETDLANSHLQMMERDIAHIRNVGGVNSENLGRETNAKSGIAIQARQEQGSVVTTAPFDNLRFAVQLLGELELSNIEQFYDQPKTIRVIGDRGKAKFVELNDMDADGNPLNSITEMHADFVVDEQDFQSNLRQAMFESLFDLIARLGQINPMVALNLLDLAVEMMNLPNTDELVGRIRQLNGQRDPEAEPTPEEKAAEANKQQAEAVQQQIAMETALQNLRQLKAKGDQLDAQALSANIDALQKALESAGVIALTPELTPVADEIMRTAGFQDKNPPEAQVPPPQAAVPQPPPPAAPAMPEQAAGIPAP